MLKIFDIRENPYVGVFVRACEGQVIVPPIVEDKELAILEEVFQVPVFRLSVGAVNILGSLVAMNSHGIVVSNIINEAEVRHLPEELNVAILRDKNNAVGNMIIASEKKALISPYLSKKSEKMIMDVLDVEVMRGTIAGLDNVGMAAVITSRGMLCHPKVTSVEKEALEEFFGVRVSIGTVNFGMPLIGAGLSANSHGAIVGSRTTGVELNRIENALDLI